jgi:hypothetical protein
VSNSTGQPPDRFHFLRLPELGLQLLALRHIARDTLDPNGHPILDDGAPAQLQENPAAVFCVGVQFNCRRSPASHQVFEEVLDSRPLFLREEPVDVQAYNLIATITCDSLARFVDRGEVPLQIDAEDHVVRVFKQVAETGLAPGQSLRRPPLFRNVLRDRQQTTLSFQFNGLG